MHVDTEEEGGDGLETTFADHAGLRGPLDSPSARGRRRTDKGVAERWLSARHSQRTCYGVLARATRALQPPSPPTGAVTHAVTRYPPWEGRLGGDVCLVWEGDREKIAKEGEICDGSRWSGIEQRESCADIFGEDKCTWVGPLHARFTPRPNVSYITPAPTSSLPDYPPTPPLLSPSHSLPSNVRRSLPPLRPAGPHRRVSVLRHTPHHAFLTPPSHSRAYCSDECENLDVTSPSISTTSSAHPSPYLRSSANVPPHLADVPALVPSALGRSLDASRTHRVRHSESSSSASSTSWSALDDECEDHDVSPGLYGHSDDEYYSGVHPDYAEGKPSSATGHLHPASSLTYARRPSTTNHRSTIPALHRRTSSVSVPSLASAGASPGFPPECYTEDDVSDGPSIPACSSSVHSKRHSRKPSDFSSLTHEEEDHEKEDTLTGKKRRNRASLPAYFSLLVSTSTTPRSQKSSALSMLSRSLHSSSSPPTPRIAHPVVDTTTAFAVPQPARVTKARTQISEAAPRGRSKRRDPDGRSSSSRRSPSRSPRPRAHVHQSAQARARLDSMEKVADWVAHSPVVAAGVRAARQLAQRRNSSPPPLPKFEKMGLGESGVDLAAAQHSSAVDDEVVEKVEERRGRRRAHELDNVPYGVDRNAPGYGNGRSGLVSRERGRAGVVRR